jgi:hypothetical protein
MSIFSAVAFIVVPVAAVVFGVILKVRANTEEVLKNTPVQLPLPKAEEHPDHDHEMQPLAR